MKRQENIFLVKPPTPKLFDFNPQEEDNQRFDTCPKLYTWTGVPIAAIYFDLWLYEFAKLKKRGENYFVYTDGHK